MSEKPLKNSEKPENVTVKNFSELGKIMKNTNLSENNKKAKIEKAKKILQKENELRVDEEEKKQNSITEEEYEKNENQIILDKLERERIGEVGKNLEKEYGERFPEVFGDTDKKNNEVLRLEYKPEKENNIPEQQVKMLESVKKISDEIKLRFSGCNTLEDLEKIKNDVWREIGGYDGLVKNKNKKNFYSQQIDTLFESRKLEILSKKENNFSEKGKMIDRILKDILDYRIVNDGVLENEISQDIDIILTEKNWESKISRLIDTIEYLNGDTLEVLEKKEKANFLKESFLEIFDKLGLERGKNVNEVKEGREGDMSHGFHVFKKENGEDTSEEQRKRLFSTEGTLGKKIKEDMIKKMGSWGESKNSQGEDILDTPEWPPESKLIEKYKGLSKERVEEIFGKIKGPSSEIINEENGPFSELSKDYFSKKNVEIRKKIQNFNEAKNKLESKKSFFKGAKGWAAIVAGVGIAGYFLFQFLPLYLWYKWILKPEYKKAVGGGKEKKK